MNSPIPLDLAKRVWDTYYATPTSDAVTEMQATLAAHLPELAACHYREVDESVIERELPVALRYVHPAPGDVAKRIATALSDATNGGHWVKCDDVPAHEHRQGTRWRETRIAGGAWEGREHWVPADPDAALIQAVRAYCNDADIGSSDDGIRDLLARLRQVAEVTAR